MHTGINTNTLSSDFKSLQSQKLSKVCVFLEIESTWADSEAPLRGKEDRKKLGEWIRGAMRERGKRERVSWVFIEGQRNKKIKKENERDW